MVNAMNQNDLSSKSNQQMEELQGLLPSSQPSDLSFDYLQQQQIDGRAIDTELILWEMANAMNQNDLSSKSDQQMEELQELLLPSPASDLSFDNLQQQQVKEEVTIEMNEMVQYCGDGLLSPDCCIYRVPIILRQLKEEAFTPKVISIGPFHYGDERLKDMENHKQILFKRFTQRAKSSLDDLVCCVKDLEPKVRASYSETINLTEKQLVKLTLMDAAFIIELFITCSESYGLVDDVKLSQPCLVDSILLDLTLLENQLPFFVIEELFNKAFPYDCRGSLPSFIRLMCSVLEHNRQKFEPDPEVKIKHFTDLIRLLYLQGKMTERDPSSMLQGHILRYNVNALQEAGIMFKPSESKCLLDLKFSGHTLEIPQVIVDDTIEIVFRNMIALEQCHYPHETYVADYAFVFDCLIDTDKDVNILVHNNIVSNYLLDSNNVAVLFSGLSKNVLRLSLDSEYLDICKRLNAYYEDPWHKKKATLRRDYCNTPWRTLASIAGIILLLLTIVQTIFSILQVVLKK